MRIVLTTGKENQKATREETEWGKRQSQVMTRGRAADSEAGRKHQGKRKTLRKSLVEIKSFQNHDSRKWTLSIIIRSLMCIINLYRLNSSNIAFIYTPIKHTQRLTIPFYYWISFAPPVFLGRTTGWILTLSCNKVKQDSGTKPSVWFLG